MAPRCPSYGAAPTSWPGETGTPCPPSSPTPPRQGLATGGGLLEGGRQTARVRGQVSAPESPRTGPGVAGGPRGHRLGPAAAILRDPHHRERDLEAATVPGLRPHRHQHDALPSRGGLRVLPPARVCAALLGAD